jgi:hypothetical protein
MIERFVMAHNKYKKRKKKEDDGKQGMDDNWVPGCVDFFLFPLQLAILGYEIITII